MNAPNMCRAPPINRIHDGVVKKLVVKPNLGSVMNFFFP
jgi:hypothetical protein